MLFFTLHGLLDVHGHPNESSSSSFSLVGLGSVRTGKVSSLRFNTHDILEIMLESFLLSWAIFGDGWADWLWWRNPNLASGAELVVDGVEWEENWSHWLLFDQIVGSQMNSPVNLVKITWCEFGWAEWNNNRFRSYWTFELLEMEGVSFIFQDSSILDVLVEENKLAASKKSSNITFSSDLSSATARSTGGMFDGLPSLSEFMELVLRAFEDSRVTRGRQRSHNILGGSRFDGGNKINLCSRFSFRVQNLYNSESLLLESRLSTSHTMMGCSGCRAEFIWLDTNCDDQQDSEAK